MKTQKVKICMILFEAALICSLTGFTQAKLIQARFPRSSDFNRSKNNPYLPKLPGLTYVYQSDSKELLVTNEITITNNIITIQGIACNIVSDIEWTFVKRLNKKFKTKETYNFYAWDKFGNVWTFGADKFEYLYNNKWRFAGLKIEDSWLAGARGALPGIVMPANPQAGLIYQQVYDEGEMENIGKILQLNTNVSIGLGDFTKCLKTEESTNLYPVKIEHKYYAPNVGLVFIEDLKAKSLKTELVDIVNISSRSKAAQILSSKFN